VLAALEAARGGRRGRGSSTCKAATPQLRVLSASEVVTGMLWHKQCVHAQLQMAGSLTGLPSCTGHSPPEAGDLRQPTWRLFVAVREHAPSSGPWCLPACTTFKLFCSRHSGRALPSTTAQSRSSYPPSLTAPTVQEVKEAQARSKLDLEDMLAM
jgi:hypothetical protein